MSEARPAQSLFAPLRPIPADDQEQVETAEQQPCMGLIVAGQQTSRLLPVVDRQRTYICPGEKHAIPRSVHLARLAAFYPNCRHCEHRHDTGQLPRSKVGRLEQSARRGTVASPFSGDGVRGAYLNHITRKTATQIAAAVAHHLWSERPLIGRMPTPESPEVPRPRRGGPMVVIGQDSRTSSPEISVGVSASLRRMGCEVVDVGCVSGPCHNFAVEHLQAAAGIFVTGSRCPDSWTGLDLIGQGGVPWSMDGTLPEIERHSKSDIPRPTRLGGTQRYFDASLPYRASLLKHYQELRPMRLACLCPERTVLEAVHSLFDGLPCELIPQLCDRPKRTSDDRETRWQIVVRSAIEELSADFVVSLDESGRSVAMMDADGRELTNVDMLRRITSQCAQAHSRLTVVVEAVTDAESLAFLTSLGADIVEIGEGAESMARAMQQSGAALGIQSAGQFWFRDPFPRCDALLTLGRLLQSLSRDEIG